MKQLEQLLTAAPDSSTPPTRSQMIWSTLLWCSAHADLIPKIMGRAPCGEKELSDIKRLLWEEEKYELLVPLEISTDQGGPLAPIDLQSQIKAEKVPDDKIISGQFTTFLRWCGPADLKVIAQKGPPIELLRLSYIALMVGYQKLSLLFTLNLDKEQVQKAGRILDDPRHKNTRLRKWLLDFYEKQPEGPEKHRLAKRILRYAKQTRG